ASYPSTRNNARSRANTQPDTAPIGSYGVPVLTERKTFVSGGTVEPAAGISLTTMPRGASNPRIEMLNGRRLAVARRPRASRSAMPITLGTRTPATVEEVRDGAVRV